MWLRVTAVTQSSCVDVLLKSVWKTISAGISCPLCLISVWKTVFLVIHDNYTAFILVCISIIISPLKQISLPQIFYNKGNNNDCHFLTYLHVPTNIWSFVSFCGNGYQLQFSDSLLPFSNSSPRYIWFSSRLWPLAARRSAITICSPWGLETIFPYWLATGPVAASLESGSNLCCYLTDQLGQTCQQQMGDTGNHREVVVVVGGGVALNRD